MKIYLISMLSFLVVFASGQNTKPKETTVFYNSLSWCADGKTLCFSVIVLDSGVFDKRHWEIGSVDIKTGKLIRITKNEVDDDWPAYSPDGKKLVFQSERDGNAQIYVMNADGRHPQRLTNNGFAEFHPVWSPDGKKILFVSTRDGNQELYKMNADGSDQVRLTTSPFKEFNPQWSPDGQKIVYYYEKGDNKDQLYIADSDGKNAVKISSDSTHNYYPSWAPDGKTIIYTMSGNVCTLNVNNPADKKLLLKGISYAKYSPDGKKIAFKKGSWPSNDIWICDSDGSNQVQITDTRQVISLFAISGSK